MLPAEYRQITGDQTDQPLLLNYLRQAYRELTAAVHSDAWLQDQTRFILEHYLGSKSLLYWIESPGQQCTLPVEQATGLHSRLQRSTVAGLWAVPATDLRTGDRQWQVLLLYVEPQHRRRGLAHHLLTHLESVVRQRGDRQIGLQVFSDNQPALKLYQQQGFSPEVLQLVKHLDQPLSPEPLL
jgi:ribosomal protein S18 acetylase RimI-like enzyme